MQTLKSINKDTIVKIENELLSAMKNCDVKKLDELLHEDLFFIVPNGQTITKDIDLETYSSGNMKITEIKPSKQKISLIGDNAIVSVIIDMKGNYFDYSIDGTYKIIRIWKSFSREWKVIAGSSTKLNENNI